ncbi:hypothetical protein OF83DRAFT_944352 [Amylostereum chailletii]|nr:hypothetical protein OF83DRAFT_944352 [Amylostereum chailletii]
MTRPESMQVCNTLQWPRFMCREHRYPSIAPTRYTVRYKVSLECSSSFRRVLLQGIPSSLRFSCPQMVLEAYVGGQEHAHYSKLELVRDGEEAISVPVFSAQADLLYLKGCSPHNHNGTRYRLAAMFQQGTTQVLVQVRTLAQRQIPKISADLDPNLVDHLPRGGNLWCATNAQITSASTRARITGKFQAKPPHAASRYNLLCAYARCSLCYASAPTSNTPGIPFGRVLRPPLRSKAQA